MAGQSSDTFARPPADSTEAAGRYPVTWSMRLPFTLRNLVRRWRSLIGMMIGVGFALSVVATLLAMSQGGIDAYTADFVRSSADLYVVQQGGTLIPILPSDVPGNIKQARNTITRIRGLPGVTTVVAVLNWSIERDRPGPRRSDTPAELVAAIGVDGDPAAIPGMLRLQAGRWPRRSDEVVIGAKFAREKNLGLADVVRLAGRDFTVVGIGRLRGVGFGADSAAYLDDRALRDRAGVGDLVNLIVIDSTDPAVTRARIAEIGSYSVFDPPDLVRLAEAANASALVIYWVFDLLALGVGALFISNVLARSVAERRMEFATMRAIGVPARLLILIVAAEAVLVSLVAGLFGIAVSLVFGLWLNGSLAPQYGLESLYSFDLKMVAGMLALSLGLGLAAALIPVRQVTRVDPVDVLREA